MDSIHYFLLSLLQLFNSPAPSFITSDESMIHFCHTLIANHSRYTGNYGYSKGEYNFLNYIFLPRKIVHVPHSQSSISALEGVLFTNFTTVFFQSNVLGR